MFRYAAEHLEEESGLEDGEERSVFRLGKREAAPLGARLDGPNRKRLPCEVSLHLEVRSFLRIDLNEMSLEGNSSSLPRKTGFKTCSLHDSLNFK